MNLHTYLNILICTYVYFPSCTHLNNINTYIYINIYMFIHIYVFIYMYTHMHIIPYSFIFTSYTYIISICIYIHIYLSIHIYIHVYIMCIYMHIWREAGDVYKCAHEWTFVTQHIYTYHSIKAGIFLFPCMYMVVFSRERPCKPFLYTFKGMVDK